MSASADELHAASILIVDDEETNVRLLARILERAGFRHVHTTREPRAVEGLYRSLAPDLILLDLHMPEMDGIAVLGRLSQLISPTDFLPVLAITGDTASETRQAVIGAGAKDFLEKPFEAAEVLVRVRNLLTTRLLHRSLQRQNDQLERTVRARTAELEEALAAAQSANRAKSRFLATMSHELRTPLNAVIGFSHHLQKNRGGHLPSKDVEMLRRISDNGRHLLCIIDDVLDLSRIEAGAAGVEREAVALDQVVFDVLEASLVANTSAGKDILVHVCMPPDMGPLMTDTPALRRVIANLVANAHKFTVEGHIRVGIRTDESGRPVRLDVIDTGVGIPADRIDAIFGAFEQAEGGTQRRFEGTGLGLAICRTLCDVLGYRLTVVSDAGVGSAFSVLFDVASDAPPSYAELASLYEETPTMCA